MKTFKSNPCIYTLHGGDDNEFLPKDAFFGVEAKSMVSKGLLPTFKQIGQAESIVSFLVLFDLKGVNAKTYTVSSKVT